MNNTQKQTAAAPMKGADVFVKCLERAGTDVIFAYPGGASMELHQSLIDSPIRVILPRHEQGGAFAAAGYARATGKTGVCMGTSGPGATNLVTAIADAYLDSIPILVITGQVPQHYIGKNAFQEIDIIGITRPICKHSFLVLDADDIPDVFAEAFHIANSGRPGPVIVDLPKDVQQTLTVPDFTRLPILRGYSAETTLDMAAVAAFRAAIEKAERPCLYVGGGVIIAEAAEELKTFAETYNIPVATTLMGVGAFPETHPLSLKWLGMHGTYYANYAANESDLLIALGARFDDRVTGNTETFAPYATIVHVDIDPSEINKNKAADIPIICNVKDVLTEMNKAPIHKDYAAWHEQIKRWKEDVPLRYDQKEHILPQYVVEKISDLTHGKAIVCPGVGQHQMWAAQFYTYERPRQHLSSGGLGTMGFGLPTAMGAKVACPDDIVVNIDGDGSFQMNIQELGTLHAENIGVKMVVLNNQHLGMVAQWEDRFYGSRRGNTVLKNDYVTNPYPDFVGIAAGYSIPGRHVWKPEEVEPAIREMLETDGPFILDVHIEYQDHVLPMIPSGKSYKEIMIE
ncbi:MAG: biosynthetic-type acetolactate synthase large subunit [Lentisphaeria bacterium]|nr:biosynthetic-type acetolactate synthase large subunit [Lentisphaeria bacterium]